MNVQLVIEGVNVTATSLMAKTLKSDWPISARQTLGFSLFSPAVRPQLHDDVTLTIDGAPVFGGIVFSLDESSRGDDRDIISRITCADYATVADGPMINGILPPQTLKQRLQQFIDTQLGYMGFTLNPAQPVGPSLPQTGYPWYKLSDALDELSVQTSYFWEINPLKQIGMFPGGSVSAPFGLDHHNIVAIGINSVRSRQKYVNRVWVRFGSGASSEITYRTAGNGTREYHVPYFVADTISQVFVNDVLHVVGAYPDPLWTWTFKADDRTLQQRSDQPLLGPTDTLVTAPFLVNWPSAAYADNPEAATRESSVKVDYPQVFDYDQALSLAAGHLRRLEGIPRQFRIVTFAYGLKPGMTVPVTNSLYGLAAVPMLITNVSYQHYGTQQDNGNPWLQCRIDLIEGNETRGNWLEFWENALTAGGGGSAASVGGIIPPPASGGPSYFVASLGGSTTTGATGLAWQDVPEAQYVKLPPDVALVADVRLRARYGATDVASVRLWDATAGAVAGAPLTNVAASSWQTLAIPFNAVADHFYVLQTKGNDADTDVLSTGNVHPL